MNIKLADERNLTVMDNLELKQYMEQWIENNKQKFFNLADDIWENPELGLEEYHSAAAIIKVLEDFGFTVKKGIGGMPTAFVAQWGERGPVAGFSVEYDALPDLSQDKNSTVHRPLKEGSPGHGCGHNILGTGAVMAGVALKNVLEKSGVPGIVRLYGAPDYTEEEQEFVNKMQREYGVEPTGIDMTIKPYGPGQTGITDASEYSWAAPFTCLWVAMGPAGGWHNWMVTACAGNSIGKKALVRGAQILCASAIDMLTNPQKIQEAQEEMRERTHNEPYKCLLPDEHKPPLGINAAVMDKFFPNRKKEI